MGGPRNFEHGKTLIELMVEQREDKDPVALRAEFERVWRENPSYPGKAIAKIWPKVNNRWARQIAAYWGLESAEEMREKVRESRPQPPPPPMVVPEDYAWVVQLVDER